MAKWGFNRAGYWLLLRIPSSSMLFEKGASMPPPFLALSASAIVPAMWTSQQTKNVPFLSKHHWKEAGEVHLFKGGMLPVANCAHKGFFSQIHNIFSALLCYFHTSDNHITLLIIDWLCGKLSCKLMSLRSCYRIFSCADKISTWDSTCFEVLPRPQKRQTTEDLHS